MGVAKKSAGDVSAPFFTAGSMRTIRIRAATALKARLIGRVRNTVGSPFETCSARRRFSSIIGPSTNPSSMGMRAAPQYPSGAPRTPKNAAR